MEDIVGELDGENVGIFEGEIDGENVGSFEGEIDGEEVGEDVTITFMSVAIGERVGALVTFSTGASVSTSSPSQSSGNQSSGT